MDKREVQNIKTAELIDVLQKKPVTISMTVASKMLKTTPLRLAAVAANSLGTAAFIVDVALPGEKHKYRVYTERLIAWLQAEDLSGMEDRTDVLVRKCRG